jgi:hypothetical protein
MVAHASTLPTLMHASAYLDILAKIVKQKMMPVMVVPARMEQHASTNALTMIASVYLDTMAKIVTTI